MKGFRTLVFQDLTHVLPSKSLQLSSPRLHTSASSRRFWNFFEFSSKDEAVARDTKKCPPSKDIVSSNLISTSELESISRIRASPPSSAPLPSTLTRNPKVQSYRFDAKSSPLISSSGMQQSAKQHDTLISLLDGNPVPRTLKWKLKGYKTLRNEQAGDFAFVPGGKCHDLDVLSRNERDEWTNPSNSANRIVHEEASVSSRAERVDNANDQDTLCLTTKAIENKDRLQRAERQNDVEIGAIETEIATTETDALKLDSSVNDRNVDAATKSMITDEKAARALQEVSTVNVPKKEDIKFLPISKSDLSANQATMRYQTQPSVRYSSRPPRRYAKPTPPVQRHSSKRRKAPPDAEESISTAPMERQQQASEFYPPDAYEASSPTARQMADTAASEWSSMEQRRADPMEYRTAKRGSGYRADRPEEARETVRREEMRQEEVEDGSRLSSRMPEQSLREELHLREEINAREETSFREEGRLAEDTRFAEETRLAEQAHPEEAPKTKAARSYPKRMDAQRNEESDYFAPRPWKHSKASTTSLTSTFDVKPTYEAILGVPTKDNSVKITSPYQDQSIKTSPCAATHARLQQSSGKGSQTGTQDRPAGSGPGSSMSGNSGGGSRKPPASYPPFTAARSSSSASCLSKRPPAGEAENPSRRPNTKNSSTNISTSCANPAPRKCDDQEGMTEGKTICTKPRQSKGRQRKCDQGRNKCQRNNKKGCKRYCCPALQTGVECDYEKFQCPKLAKGCGQQRQTKTKKPKRDPTCLPEEAEHKETRGRDCERPCRRERQCNRERRDRSCDRERQSCPRNRDRSCKRQERQDCSQGREQQGREICTKPRRRESCKRRKCENRDGCKRPTKCSGRRNYTQSAYIKRSKSSQSIRRYSSLPAFALSLIGMKVSGESKQKVLDCPSMGRFYGKRETPPSCKSPESDSGSKGCKRPPHKCLVSKSSDTKCKATQRAENKCETTKENKCKSSCDNMKPKRAGPCKTESSKSKSDDYCAKRRAELCKDNKKEASSEATESVKDRIEREKKEMAECKRSLCSDKNKKKKDKKDKVVAKGLERVVSPCKQKQSKKGVKNSSSTKLSCIGGPLNCLCNIKSTVAAMQENKRFILSDRNYSSINIGNPDDYSENVSSDEGKKFWTFYEDDDVGMESVPAVVETQEIEDVERNEPNWFRSWFHNRPQLEQF